MWDQKSTDLSTSRGISADGGGHADMLVVTTTMGMLNRLQHKQCILVIKTQRASLPAFLKTVKKTDCILLHKIMPGNITVAHGKKNKHNCNNKIKTACFNTSKIQIKFNLPKYVSVLHTACGCLLKGMPKQFPYWAVCQICTFIVNVIYTWKITPASPI